MSNLPLALVAAALAAVAVPPAHAVEAGKEAPLFEADATSGRFRLEDYRGRRNVLLAFYFKDFSPG